MDAQLRLVDLVWSALLIGCSTGQAPVNLPEEASIIKVFQSNDLNNDECLSLPEWTTMSEIATEEVKNESSNADQFKGWILEIFREIDSDSNECVSTSEYIQFSKMSRRTSTQVSG